MCFKEDSDWIGFSIDYFQSLIGITIVVDKNFKVHCNEVNK